MVYLIFEDQKTQFSPQRLVGLHLMKFSTIRIIFNATVIDFAFLTGIVIEVLSFANLPNNAFSVVVFSKKSSMLLKLVLTLTNLGCFISVITNPIVFRCYYKRETGEKC